MKSTFGASMWLVEKFQSSDRSTVCPSRESWKRSGLLHPSRSVACFSLLVVSRCDSWTVFVVTEIQDCCVCVRVRAVDPVHESGVAVQSSRPGVRHARIVIFILDVAAFRTRLAVRGLLFILFGTPLCRRAVFLYLRWKKASSVSHFFTTDVRFGRSSCSWWTRTVQSACRNLASTLSPSAWT